MFRGLYRERASNVFQKILVGAIWIVVARSGSVLCTGTVLVLNRVCTPSRYAQDLQYEHVYVCNPTNI